MLGEFTEQVAAVSDFRSVSLTVRAIVVHNKCVLGRERKIRGSSFNLSTWRREQRRFISAERLTRAANAALFFNFHQRRALSRLIFTIPQRYFRFLSAAGSAVRTNNLSSSAYHIDIMYRCDSIRFLSFCLISKSMIASLINNSLRSSCLYHIYVVSHIA